MKPITRFHPLPAAAAAFALVLVLAPAGARAADTLTASTTRATAMVPKDSDEIIGQDARSTTGQDLGEIRDLVVDAQGRIVFALVASGGILGVGDTLRAVPWGAVTSTGTPDNRVIAIDLHGADWIRAPLARVDQLEALGLEQRGRDFFQYYGRDWNNDLGGSAGTGRLLLVSRIDDSEVTREGAHVGSVEDVLVHGNRVIPVLETDAAFAGAERELAVSLNHLSWPAPESRIASTQLTREDLALAKPIPGPAALGEGSSYVWVYSPTGRKPAPIVTSSDTPSTPAGRASIDQVRRTLRADATLGTALEHVQFVNQNGKLVLAGSVPSREARERIGARAAEAARGWDVENRLVVGAAE